MDLVKTAKEVILTHGLKPTYWVAYSGGLDSHVLLHLFSHIRSHFPIQLQALHIHHGLNQKADAWSSHCEKVCEALKIPLQQKKIYLAKLPKKSLEALARQARYEALASFFSPNDILLTAHHQDDQAETLLLQLLRGAGPKGLSAMPRQKIFARGLHLRPLLDFTRDELTHYASFHQLRWIDDDSNNNKAIHRNFLRHDILPLLKKQWPAATRLLARSAEHCAAAEKILLDKAKADLLYCEVESPDLNAPFFKATLSIPKLQLLTLECQLHVLRLWFSTLNFSLPSTVKMQQILKIFTAAKDKLPYVAWENVEVRRYRDRLYAMPALLPHDATQRIALADNMTLRFRQGGEKIAIRGMHRELKTLFQEWGVPPWWRDRIGLVYQQEELIAIQGFPLFSKEGEKSASELFFTTLTATTPST